MPDLRRSTAGLPAHVEVAEDVTTSRTCLRCGSPLTPVRPRRPGALSRALDWSLVVLAFGLCAGAAALAGMRFAQALPLVLVVTLFAIVYLRPGHEDERLPDQYFRLLAFFFPAVTAVVNWASGATLWTWLTSAAISTGLIVRALAEPPGRAPYVLRCRDCGASYPGDRL